MSVATATAIATGTAAAAAVGGNLVQRAMAGDRGSLDALMGEVRDRVLARVRRTTFDADCAENLAQETVLAVVRSLERLRRADRFWPWVMSIAANKVRQYYRRELRHCVIQLSVLDGAGLPLLLDAPPILEASRRENSAVVLIALAGMAGRYREVLEMRYFERLAYATIAVRLGCTQASARVAVLRAKRALRRELERFGLTAVALQAA